MRFPLELPLGKHVPLYGSIPGCGFRLRRHPETTSQFERRFRDVLSAWLPSGKRVPVCVAKAFSLRSRPAQSSILRGTGGIR